MCYNDLKGRACRVIIRSVGDGWNTEVCSEGTFTDGQIKTLLYSIDGDDCVLTIDGGRVEQLRRGSQSLSLAFEKMRRTHCVIGEGGLSGTYDIHTQRLDYFSGKGGFRLSLEYKNGTDGELIKLDLKAIFTERRD